MNVPLSDVVAPLHEHDDAVRRFDADLALVVDAAPADVGDDLGLLRRRAVDAYRRALAVAAGAPHHLGWPRLALVTAAFLARAEPVDGATAQDALARLRLLADDRP